MTQNGNFENCKIIQHFRRQPTGVMTQLFDINIDTRIVKNVKDFYNFYNPYWLTQIYHVGSVGDTWNQNNWPTINKLGETEYFNCIF